MNKLLQKALLFIFLCSSPVFATATSSVKKDEYTSLEALFIKKTEKRESPANYVQDAYKRLSTLLNAVKKDDYKEFLDTAKERVGDLITQQLSGDKTITRYRVRSADMEMVFRLPLSVSQPESGLKPEEVIPKYTCASEDKPLFNALETEISQNCNLNLLQFAIKNRAVNVVHALLLQNVEYDVNRLDNTQNVGNTQQDDTDLLMRAVKYMAYSKGEETTQGASKPVTDEDIIAKSEKSLKILAMLIAAGVTCGNSKYPSKGETPLTQLMKQLSNSQTGYATPELEGVMRKGVLILINAGFDPYEERSNGERSPFIQAVVKKDNAIIATSVACFGKEHEKDTALVNDGTFRGEINKSFNLHNQLTTDSYKSIIERASKSSLKDAEASIESIRVELLKDRKDMMKYFMDVHNIGDTDFVDRLFVNDSYLKLMPKRKQDLFQASIDKLENIKKQVEGAVRILNYDDDDKGSALDNLCNEISRRKALLGQKVDGSGIKANHAHLEHGNCNMSYTEAVALGNEVEASDGVVKPFVVLDKITADLERKAQHHIDKGKKKQAELYPANAPQPSDTPQQALGQSGSQVGQNSSLHNPSQTLSTSTPQPGSQLQAPGSKNSPPVSQPVTQHKDETAGEDPLTRRSFAQYAGIGLAVGGVALTLFLLMKKLRSHEDNESESEDDEIKQRHAHGKDVSRS